MDNSSLQAAQRLDGQFRKINRQLLGAKARLESMERGRAQLLDEKADLESRVSDLRTRLAEVRSSKIQLEQEIQQKRSERCCVDLVVARLEELLARFKAHNDLFSGEQVPDLDQETPIILEKLAKVVDRLKAENCPLAEDEYLNILRDLRSKHSEIDKELSVLEAIECNDWDHDSVLPIWIDQFCECSPNQSSPTLSRLSNITIPRTDEPPNVLEHMKKAEPIPPPNIQCLGQTLENEIRNLQKRRDQEVGIYQDQLDTLKSLKTLMERHESASSFDIAKFQAKIKERVELVPQIESIESVTIPDIHRNDNNSDPVRILADQFTKFADELGHVHAELVMQPENELPSIQPFQMPPDPPCVKESRVSRELTELTEQLRQLSETAREFIPQVRDPTPTPEPEPEMCIEVDMPPLLPDQLESPDIDGFKELVMSKLAPSLAKQLEDPNFGFIMPKIEEIEDDGEHVEDEIEEQDSDVQARAAELNSILKSIAVMDLPPIPTVTSTPELRETYDKLDTNPLLDAVGQILTCQQQSASSLRDEIRELEQSISSIEFEMSRFTEEEDVNEEELEVMDREIQECERRAMENKSEFNVILQEVRKLSAQCEEQKAQNMALAEELEGAEDLSKRIKEKERELKEAREDLTQVRRAFQEEQEAKALLLGMKQNL